LIERKVTRRYVYGLLHAAQEHSCVDEIEKILKTLDHIIRGSETTNILYHPVISRERKRKLLHNLLGDNLPHILNRFFDYVINKKRERIFGSLYEEFKKAADTFRGVITAKVRTAVNLTGNQVLALKKELEKTLGKIVEIEVAVDKTLLAGLQIFVGTYVIDGSIAGRLSLFHRHLQHKLGQLKPVA
jgi:F-type H+-transporting ATPase subunit delta